MARSNLDRGNKLLCVTYNLKHQMFSKYRWWHMHEFRKINNYVNQAEGSLTNPIVTSFCYMWSMIKMKLSLFPMQKLDQSF